MTMRAAAETPAVIMRPACPDDEAFLRRLFVESRPELQLLPAEVVALQVAAQRMQYCSAHPAAVDEIVELGGEAVGRCWTAFTAGELHVLDLAIRADRRRHGIGRAVLRAVAARAAAEGVPVGLTVWAANGDARRLYRSAGFHDVGESGGYVAMRLDRAAAEHLDYDAVFNQSVGSGP